VNHPEALAKKAASFGRWATQAGRSNTPIEKLLQAALDAERIPYMLGNHIGRYLPDVTLLDAPILLEADGYFHRIPRVIERDGKRDAELAQAGYQVLRFSGFDLRRDMPNCIARIREALQSRRP
jgi:very-short-patch-repair endonuclease